MEFWKGPVAGFDINQSPTALVGFPVVSVRSQAVFEKHVSKGLSNYGPHGHNVATLRLLFFAEGVWGPCEPSCFFDNLTSIFRPHF